MKTTARLATLVLALIAAPAGADDRAPQGTAFGAGLGVKLPAAQSQPNLIVGSYYRDGLQIQPFLVYSATRDENVYDDGVVIARDRSSERAVGAGAVFKYPVVRRNGIDLQLLAGASHERSRSEFQPEGPNNDAHSETRHLSLGYGLGVEGWISPRVSLAASALNPLLARDTSRTTQEDIAATVITSSERRSVGFAWNPDVSVAVVFWF